MNIRNTLAMLLVLIGTTSAALAQSIGLQPPSETPWNLYVPSRIPNDFNSIIGTGTLISGSNNAGDYGYEYHFSLPFDFFFIGQTYSAGHSLAVGSNGYLSFNGSSYNGGPIYAYYGYYFGPEHDDE